MMLKKTVEELWLCIHVQISDVCCRLEKYGNEEEAMELRSAQESLRLLEGVFDRIADAIDAPPWATPLDIENLARSLRRAVGVR